ncbi:UDP-N-acetylmuramoyl-L-alanyl-D-glutamate--2,6-diaminopimelate ligase [Limnobacter sp.]|uniref:UDP-N-acetylmuramoyl-L-alanyl-D-glutamate--2, 6-diaminopimelate ligase n=1 Tax=Limnobacter sp. TaxID=2003368 RepID=UPI003512946B
MISAYLHSVSEVIAELHERGFYADCSALVTDHRRLSGPQDVFLATPGASFDPRILADDLIREQRCGLVLVEHDDARVYQSASVLPVLNLKTSLGELAKSYYGAPSDSLTVIAVTGTNGKTTVTRWLAQTLTALGRRAAVLGTLGYGAPESPRAHTGLTTPDVVGVHHTLHALKREGFEAVCLEASSIGLEQRRLAGVTIDWAVFTNFSQDHLDYHGTMEAYGQSKLILASWPTLRGAVVNVDDDLGLRFAETLQARQVACTRVARRTQADIRLLSQHHTSQGLQVELLANGLQSLRFSAAVLGDFNADNLALVTSLLLQLGHSPADIERACTYISAAPGRMETVGEAPCVVVDYAHTPDALEKVLQALRPVAVARGGQLLVVFGCGGDRDRSKRPIMGRLAAELADQVVLTSDNPRSEEPESILKEIASGVPATLLNKVRVDVNRVSAIESAISGANSNDVVLLAGKGHETTQTIGAEVRQHSDVLCAKAALAKRGHHA